MTALRALCSATLVVGFLVGGVTAAHAAGQSWSGRYSMQTLASQKDGTSMSARQRESDFSAVFTFSTTCSGTCVATADGPASSNPTAPNPQRFAWDGQRWVSAYDWVWQCSFGDDVPSEWSPARSYAIYAPQPDGSLRGMWHTNISNGACRGSVVMPVAAVPA